jgi:hypothetical protein
VEASWASTLELLQRPERLWSRAPAYAAPGQSSVLAHAHPLSLPRQCGRIDAAAEPGLFARSGAAAGGQRGSDDVPKPVLKHVAERVSCPSFPDQPQPDQ